MKSIITVREKEVRITRGLVQIARLEGEGYRYLGDPADMIEGLKNCGKRIDLFTFTQRLADTSPKFSYPMEWDNYAVLPVTTFDHWWTKQIGFKARNKTKQAEKKGVQVREVPFDDALVKGIGEVYNECPVRQGAPNSHYGKSFDELYRMTSTFLDTSIFIGAFIDNALIGFVKLVHDETRAQAGLMHIISMVRHRDKAPTNALVAQAVRSCADRRISHLHYARFIYGKKTKSSLIDFKERNGFQQVLVPRYYVPMTGAGALAFRLGLHQRLADRIPESLAGKLRQVRAAWYSRHLSSPEEAL
jgi:hypothetical protein